MSEYYRLCVTTELNYINKHKNKILDEVFPSGWYEIKDSELYKNRMILHFEVNYE